MCSSINDAVQRTCSEKVCRNLFGPVDHEQLKIDNEQMMRECLEEAKDKWNFDFLHDQPLEGNFKWEKVDTADLCRVPLVCVTPVVIESPEAGSENENKDHEAAVEVLDSCSAQEDTVVVSASHEPSGIAAHQDSAGNVATSATSTTSLKRKQTTLKDFYHSKRRSGQPASKSSP